MSAQVLGYPQSIGASRQRAAGASVVGHSLGYAAALCIFVAATLPHGRTSGTDALTTDAAASSTAVDAPQLPAASGQGLALADGGGFAVQAQGNLVADAGLFGLPSAATPIVEVAAGTAVAIAGELRIATGLTARRVLWVRVDEGSRFRYGFVAAEAIRVMAGHAPQLDSGLLFGQRDATVSHGGATPEDAAVMAASIDPGQGVNPESTAGIGWLPATVTRWWPAIQRAAAKHAVDPDLVAIVVLVESGGDPLARSQAGATGLMQLMPATAAELATRAGVQHFDASMLTDPELNLDLGSSYLAQQLAAFGTASDPDWQRSVELAAAAYNGGPGMVAAVSRGERGMPAETRSYVSWVGGMWRERSAPESSTFSRWWWAGGQRLVAAAESREASR